MGFKPREKTYKLVWPDDSELHGLEVRTKGASLGDLLNLVRLAQNAARGVLDDVPELFERFADVLLSWNLEDKDDQPVPATVQGLHSQDFGLVQKIIEAWMSNVAGVDPSLGKDSNSGAISPVLSLPMELPSTSRAS